MKIRMHFKDPEVRDEIDSAMDQDQRDDQRIDEVYDGLEKWVKGCESVIIEYDTVTQTAVVIPHA